VFVHLRFLNTHFLEFQMFICVFPAPVIVSAFLQGGPDPYIRKCAQNQHLMTRCALEASLVPFVGFNDDYVWPMY
jgi:hypothetical protein